MSENLLMATAFSGTGLTFGPVAGKLMAELLLGPKRPLANFFSPARIMAIASGKAVLSENLNVAKHFVADRFKGETIDSLQEIPAGEGRLVWYGGQQLAVFREPNGQMHTLSPVCTHLGCHVQWNEAEQTWDCPCHGGRFSALGERLYGPPASDLKKIAIEK
jgi:Rieske Fe-S protein